MQILIHIFLAVLWIIISTSKFKIHPLIALIVASIWVGLASGMDFLLSLDEFGKGFGGLIGQVGLIIVLGSVFGVLLEKSNAAVVIAHSLWNSVGKKFPSLSTSFMGSVVGVPVFCDSGFILLNPIGKSLAKASELSPLTFSLSLAGGLYMSHILIPPTPGPLAVSGIFEMEQNLGLVLLVGLAIAIPVILVTAWWAGKFKKKFPESYQEDFEPQEQNLKVKVSVFWSVMVIAIPLIMITIGNLTVFFPNELVRSFFLICGNPLVAIGAGLLVGFMTLKQPISGSNLFSISFTEGIKIAGPILVLTGAGAGFGAILKLLNLNLIFQEFNFNSDSGVVWLLGCFGLAAFLKTAQGSSTSAMIIAASIALSVIPSGMLENQVYTALCISAIGAGAMTVSHANDSYFWIVKEFTGLTVKEALLSYTVLTALMGITALLTVLIFYWIL
ncbi:GntP family permease [Belliella sp. R4-6]|uniref:GntP family permease n=1 Tax=Belliella alkalica TaxID=1730871 RepID=A0ABS9VAH8_9BACT|nr:GntP family permease [Belliella alkalica]MCH7413437.1 GntP family permease [Belliella alkalica]